MSKIGLQPVTIPDQVNVTVFDSQIKVSGPKGELVFKVRPEITVTVDQDKVNVGRKAESKFAKSLHGLTRSIIANMIKGVTEGHEKQLELVGVGYRAAKQGEDLILNVGYSHPVVVKQAVGIQMDTKDNKITVTGADKAQVGEIAARIRRVRPPEPYKGKGIRYEGEIVRRKAGKAAKAGAGA